MIIKRSAAWRLAFLCWVMLVSALSSQAQLNTSNQLVPTSFKFRYICFVIDTPKNISVKQTDFPDVLKQMQNGVGPDLRDEKAFVQALESSGKGSKVLILLKGSKTVKSGESLSFNDLQGLLPYAAQISNDVTIKATSFEQAQVTQNGEFLFDVPGLSPKRDILAIQKPAFGLNWKDAIKAHTKFDRTYSMGILNYGSKNFVYAYIVSVVE